MMRIECPGCHYSAEVDPAKIPHGGATAKCPRCAAVFAVAPPAPAGLPDTPQLVTCPKCGAEQDASERCGLCGIVYAKYRLAATRRTPDEDAATAELVSPVVPQPASILEPAAFGYGRSEIMTWAGEGHLAAADLPQALNIAGTLPTPAAWRRFLDGLTLWLGALFLALAVIFFFAYNWRELGHFARFGIVELLLAAAVIASWRLGLEQMAGKAALLAATLLVGALLALVGQTYQTGADPWELFAAWALFVLPWVAIARFAPLWLLLLALVNLAIGLYYHAFAGIFGMLFGKQTLWWTLAGVNSAALAAWELAASRGMPWLAERWAPRIVATAAAGAITLLAAWGIVDDGSSGVAEFCGYAAWLTGAYAIYRHRRYDLYLLALGVLSLVVFVAVFLGHSMLRGGETAGSFLFIGIAVLGLSAAGGWWLRRVAREVEA
jgi:predicted Zn finger-like uncharacterized protein